MNIDQVDNQLTDAHVNMAQAFHDRMFMLIVGMFLAVSAVALLCGLYSCWSIRRMEKR